MTSASVCLNCDTPLDGRYCVACGQDSRPPQRSLLAILGEFLSELVSFEGRMFRSLATLVVPGKLTLLYLEGKRARFTPPFRLYLIASLLLFSTTLTLTPPDPEGLNLFIGGVRIGEQREGDVTRTIELIKDEGWGRVLPSVAGERIERLRAMSAEDAVSVVFSGLRRYLPAGFIVLVPLVAFALHLLFLFPKRARRWFVEHLVTAVHLQAALFLAVSIGWTVGPLFIEEAGKYLIVVAALLSWFLVYLPWTLRRVYGQSRTWTAVKWFLLLWLYGQCAGLIMSIAILLAIWNV